jgi:hypothetical protein
MTMGEHSTPVWPTYQAPIFPKKSHLYAKGTSGWIF